MADTPSDGLPFVFDGRDVHFDPEKRTHFDLIAALAGVDPEHPTDDAVRTIEAWAAARPWRCGRFHTWRGHVRAFTLTPPISGLPGPSEDGPEERDAALRLRCERALMARLVS